MIGVRTNQTLSGLYIIDSAALVLAQLFTPEKVSGPVQNLLVSRNRGRV